MSSLNERKHSPMAEQSHPPAVTLPYMCPPKSSFKLFSFYFTCFRAYERTLYMFCHTHFTYPHFLMCLVSKKGLFIISFLNFTNRKFPLVCNKICFTSPSHCSDWPQSLLPTSISNTLSSPDHFSTYLHIIRVY